LQQGVSGHMEISRYTTDIIKWHWGPPASKMSNLRLSK